MRISEVSIYNYLNYHHFLNDYIQSFPNEGRGLKSKIAKYIGCQTTYISRVFAGKAQLTPEQAIAVSEIFEFTETEMGFFLDQVNYSRAATQNLKNFYEQKLKVEQKKKVDISSQINQQDTLKKEFKDQYYNSWVPSAVHIFLTMDKIKTREDLVQIMRVSPEVIQDVLSFLLDAGLIQKQGFQYVVTKSKVHTAADSPYTVKHHTNWRIQTLNKLQSKGVGGDLHYSSVFTADESTVFEIKDEIVQQIVKIKKKIKNATASGGYCLNFDIFNF